MINRFFLIGGGLAVAGTGTGVGIYYGVGGGNGQKASNLGPTEPKAQSEVPPKPSPGTSQGRSA